MKMVHVLDEEYGAAESCDIETFLDANLGDDWVCDHVRRLQPGEEFRCGGGAAPAYTITVSEVG